jgi:hypothetical protein
MNFAVVYPVKRVRGGSYRTTPGSGLDAVA